MKTKLLVLVLLFSLNSLVFGQICGTPPYSNENLQQKQSNSVNITNSLYLSNSTSICVDVKYHIVRESNGTGGFNISNLNNVTDRLNEAFNEHKIYFNSLGHDFINNSTYYNIDDPQGVYTEFDALVQINNDPNAINIYLVNNAEAYAGAARYKNNYAVIVNSSAVSTTTPHEVGHCFDLIHTHENGNENIDGSNCSWAGDKVCDTPADPGLNSSNVNFFCNYTGGNGYNPDTRNIMSYSRNYCREHFTFGQNTRIRQAFASSSVLQQVVSNSCSIPELSGNSAVCNSNTTYTLQNGGSSVTWQVSTNLQVLSSNNTNITVKPINSTVIGDGFIEAVLPNETLRKNVWIGIPSAPSSILGFCCNGKNFGSESIYEFTVRANNLGANQFNWLVAGGTILEGQGTNTIIVKTAKVTGSNKVYFDVSARVGNSCGWSSYLWRSGYVTSGVGPAIFSVYPNPADNEVTISVADIQAISETDATNEAISVGEVKIYDFFGSVKKVKKTNSDQKSITINVSDLQKGTYLILINRGTITESHKLIIK